MNRTLRWAGRLALGVGVAGCPQVPPTPERIAPTNACPDFPCGAYADGGAACSEGVCVDPSPAPPAHLVLLVAVPADANNAPGLTFALSFADVAGDAGVAFLPSILNLGRYLVSPQDVSDVKGNTGATQDLSTSLTSLPVHATYRPLWPLGSVSPAVIPDAGVPLADFAAVGLAVYPVEVDALPARDVGFQGPFGAPDLAFQTYVQANVTYERTLTPAPPFDRTFPPDIQQVAFAPNDAPHPALDVAPEVTRKTEATPTIPTFDLSRADGMHLDGWTTYLRDATTKRPISPVKSLSGAATPDGGVLLPTSHHPPPLGNNRPDALTNAELVMVPPSAETLPTAVFPAVAVLPRAETYAFVPHPVTVQGSISWSDGNPVSADIVFEATGIYAVPPSPPAPPADAGAPGDGGGGGKGADGGPSFPLQTQGFEYVARATALPDIANGTSTYQVVLPRGEYRVAVRPLDGASPRADGASVSHAVRVLENFDTGQTGDPVVGPAIAIDPAPVLSGVALVADGRPLSGATVEALPIHCARPMRDDAGAPAPDSPACMPRYAQTVTAPREGSFAVALDPGEYVVRVEPAEGTRLPWVARVISVPAPGPLAFRVPAPVHRQLQLFGQDAIAVTNAIVRMFALRGDSPAVELGRAITDSNGRFDMYIDPDAQ